jgi:hypothetical protein
LVSSSEKYRCWRQMKLFHLVILTIQLRHPAGLRTVHLMAGLEEQWLMSHWRPPPPPNKALSYTWLPKVHGSYSGLVSY